MQRVCLSRLKMLTIVIYYFITPYFETPDWCLKYFKRDDTPSVDGLFVPCQDAEHGIVRYSNLPKVIPLVSSSVDLFCLLCLCLFRYFQFKWRRLTRAEKVGNWIFFIV